MTILLVNTGYYPNILGGAEIFVQKLAEGLVENNLKVFVVCCGKQKDKYIHNGVTIFQFEELNSKFKLLKRIKDVYDIGFNKLIQEYITEIKPNIIHTVNLYGLSYSIWACARKNNIPIVHTTQDMILIESKKIWKFTLGIYKKLISKHVKVFTAPTEYVLNQFKNKNFFSHAIVHEVIYNSINFNLDRLKDIINLKIEKSKQESKIKFAFLGRIEEFKGIKWLVDIFVKNDFKNAELHIFGHGTAKSWVAEKSEQYRNIYVNDFLGQKELYEELKEIDVLIVPSLWEEPFGIVILDAYSNAIPVIITRKGGMPELVNANRTGIIIDINDQDLYNAINYYCLRENIVNTFDEILNLVCKFDINIQIDKFIRIYNNVINEKNN